MPIRPCTPESVRRSASRLRFLLNQPALLHASLHESKRTCGNASCRCSRGQLHRSHIIRVMYGGKQISVHVPAAWESRVREWIERDREIRSLLLEISTAYLQRLRARKE